MKVLTAVFNPIAHDGRAQRATRALTPLGGVELICPDGAPVPQDLPYSVRTVRLPKGLGSRFTEHVVFWFHIIRGALRSRPEVIYVHDHYLALAGVMSARFVGAKLVYDAHELAIPENGGHRAWQDKAKYLFDRLAVRFADLIVTTSIERAEIMREHYLLAETPLVIPNFLETPVSVQNIGSPLQADRHSISALYVYEGHITIERKLDLFVKAMERLPDDHHLLIVGDGPHLGDLEQLAVEREVASRVHFTGRVSREQVHALLPGCDVGLISYSWEGLNNLYCSPNKIFEYAAAGLPVVSSSQPPLRAMIETFGVGRLFPQVADAVDVAEVMQDVFWNKRALASRVPQFLQQHRWDEAAERLRQAVRRISEGI